MQQSNSTPSFFTTKEKRILACSSLPTLCALMFLIPIVSDPESLYLPIALTCCIGLFTGTLLICSFVACYKIKKALSKNANQQLEKAPPPPPAPNV